MFRFLVWAERFPPGIRFPPVAGGDGGILAVAPGFGPPRHPVRDAGPFWTAKF